MISLIRKSFSGDGLKAKVFRSTGMTVLDVLGSNFMRLLSNLILTRLLFPEAFGLMALAQVFIYGLQTFSDVGLNSAIIQSKKGDDQTFLNTVWSIQIIRGAALWVFSCLLAVPAVKIYGEPQLLTLLPALALSTLISGFQPTKEQLANRHLMIEKVIVLKLCVQFITLIIMSLIAYFYRSVWALVIGTLIGAVIRVVAFNFLLPGKSNSWRLEREAVSEILNYGIFIFFATISSFLINMSDRAILGAYIDTVTFGVYSIGLMIGILPGLVITTIAKKVLFPLYRIKPPAFSEENRKNFLKAKRCVLFGAFLILSLMAFSGIWVIELLYDSRYSLAGPITVLFALREVPNLTAVGTQSILLANSDSRRYFYLQLISAVLLTTVTFIAVSNYGLVGAVLGPGIAYFILYPVRAYFSHYYQGWDFLGDSIFFIISTLTTGLGCLIYWDKISFLFD